MNNEFSLSKQNAKEYLNNLLENINNTNIVDSTSFELSHFNLNDNSFINEFLQKITCFEKSEVSNKHIYRISLISNNQNDYDLINSEMKNIKLTNKNIQTSRVLDTIKCESLYVGSSATSLTSRMKNHLGYGSIKPYSLHLKYWFPDVNNDLKIEIIKLNENTTQSSLQLLEDFYWNQSKPLFGKKGSK